MLWQTASSWYEDHIYSCNKRPSATILKLNQFMEESGAVFHYLYQIFCLWEVKKQEEWSLKGLSVLRPSGPDSIGSMCFVAWRQVGWVTANWDGSTSLGLTVALKQTTGAAGVSSRQSKHTRDVWMFTLTSPSQQDRDLDFLI